MVFAERVERLAAHETVIGVIGYRLGTHPLEHLVEGFGGGALEPCVLLACGTHSVDNLVAVAESVDELVDRVHIVLQVGVHGDGGVTAVGARGHEPGEERVLMATVVGELYAAEQVCVAFVQIADDAPGVVFGTVVDEQDAALFADPSGFGKMCDFGGQHVGRVHEPFRLVVAGKHKIHDRLVAAVGALAGTIATGARDARFLRVCLEDHLPILILSSKPSHPGSGPCSCAIDSLAVGGA